MIRSVSAYINSEQTKKLAQELQKISKGQEKQLKVVQASLNQTELNIVKQKLREYKETKAAENLERFAEARAQEIKTKNEKKAMSVQ